ncbi:hypothetical protein GCM10009549_48430 [Streptomyces thermoalcalitolerans]|uniref:Response regulatory domain-containing protein n=1 Tax=Streptomyces thermoalcalitolerans TaxID=65605 RepID=A0ABP3ZSW3_9ACTN
MLAGRVSHRRSEHAVGPLGAHDPLPHEPPKSTFRERRGLGRCGIEVDDGLEMPGINAYDIAVLDRDIPGPSGDEITKRTVAPGSGMPVLMLTAADRPDHRTLTLTPRSAGGLRITVELPSTPSHPGGDAPPRRRSALPGPGRRGTPPHE